MNKEHLLLKHENFENSTWVFRFCQLKKYFTNLSSIMIHIPELMVSSFETNLTTQDINWLIKIPQISINVMNQNILLMPDRRFIRNLKKLASQVTITTAHTRYCNAEYRNYFEVPLHKLSVWISPEQYQFIQWSEKDDLIVVSPDPHPKKAQVLNKLSKIANLRVQIIQNLTYQEYKKLISTAKWTLTFGEGLDGYFIEPVFSGAIAFAIYNEYFFTSDFKSLKTVYENIETMLSMLNTDIVTLDSLNEFATYQQHQYNLCAKYYSKTEYKKSIAEFYKGEYTFK